MTREESGNDTGLLPKLTTRNLIRELFRSDYPEQIITQIPAQSLHMAVRYAGLPSSIELLEIASLEQCRLMMDLDCWEGDRIRAAGFWDWLDVTDSAKSLSFLRRLLQFVDYKLVTFFCNRFVDIVINEEHSDPPPGPGYYTPDRGMSWIKVDCENEHENFLLSRLLASIFEADPDTYYQLLATAQSNTSSMLEEAAYEDKNKRLASEGIPDDDYAAQIHVPISEPDFRALLKQPSGHVVTDISPVQPLVYSGESVEPFSLLLEGHSELLEGELTLLMNSGLVHFRVSYWEPEELERFILKVKGSINIGLEVIRDRLELDLTTTLSQVGLQPIYRLGLSELWSLRRLSNFPRSSSEVNQRQTEIWRCLQLPFPEYLEPLSEQSSEEDSKDEPRPFMHLNEVERTRAVFNEKSLPLLGR